MSDAAGETVSEMADLPFFPCPRMFDHESHVYISVIVGGNPGPVPQIACFCPGSMTKPPPA